MKVEKTRLPDERIDLAAVGTEEQVMHLLWAKKCKYLRRVEGGFMLTKKGEWAAIVALNDLYKADEKREDGIRRGEWSLEQPKKHRTRLGSKANDGKEMLCDEAKHEAKKAADKRHHKFPLNSKEILLAIIFGLLGSMLAKLLCFLCSLHP
ncbi:MAG: hypothetical protein ACI4WX_11755 [Aristaeellaceae bacterium]